MAVFTSIAIGAAAIGTTAYGSYKQSKAAKAQAAATQQQIEAERRAEALRREQMELDARRRQREIVRQQQRTRAAALATATAQGTSQGSGLQGAYGAIAGQSGVNMLGVSQNLEFGQRMFGINSDISDARLAYANAGTMMSEGRGWSNLGSSLFASMDPASRVFGGLGRGASAGGAASYGGWYNLAQTGGHPFPTPYG